MPFSELTWWLVELQALALIIFALIPFAKRRTYYPLQCSIKLLSEAAGVRPYEATLSAEPPTVAQEALVANLNKKGLIRNYTWWGVALLLLLVLADIAILWHKWRWDEPAAGYRSWLVLAIAFIILSSLGAALIRSSVAVLWRYICRHVFQLAKIHRNPEPGKLFADDFYTQLGYPMRLSFDHRLIRSQGLKGQVVEDFWLYPQDMDNTSSMNSLELMQFVTYDLVRQAKSYYEFVELCQPAKIKEKYNFELHYSLPEMIAKYADPDVYPELQRMKEKTTSVAAAHDWGSSVLGLSLMDRFHKDVMKNSWNDSVLSEETNFTSIELFDEIKRHAMQFNIKAMQEMLNGLLQSIVLVNPSVLHRDITGDVRQWTFIQKTLGEKLTEFDTTQNPEVCGREQLVHFIAFMNLLQLIWSIRHYRLNNTVLNGYFSPVFNWILVLFPTTIMLLSLYIWDYLHPFTHTFNSIVVGTAIAAITACGLPFAMVWFNLIGTGTFRVDPSDLDDTYMACERDPVFRLLREFSRISLRIRVWAAQSGLFEPPTSEHEMAASSYSQELTRERKMAYSQGQRSSVFEPNMWTLFRALINWILWCYFILMNGYVLSWHLIKALQTTGDWLNIGKSSLSYDLLLILGLFTMLAYGTFMALQRKFIQGLRTSVAMTMIKRIVSDTGHVEENGGIDQQLARTFKPLETNLYLQTFNPRTGNLFIFIQLASLIVSTILQI
jgi:hypothetical protein